MSQIITCSLPGVAIYGSSTRGYRGSQLDHSKVNHISFDRNLSSKASLRSVRCKATQTQSVQKKSSSATLQRDKKGKVQGPKLDDGSGGFPPFRFGKGGGGGGGGGRLAVVKIGGNGTSTAAFIGGSNYFGRFLLFGCVLLLDYLKEFEKYMLARKHQGGDDAGNGLLHE